MKLDLKKILLLPIMALSVVVGGCTWSKPTQEELFEEYKAAYNNTMSKQVFSATVAMVGEADGSSSEMITNYTVNENGTYRKNSVQELYIVKKGDKYYSYTSIGTTKTYMEITEEEWNSFKSPFKTIELDPKPGNNIDEMIENLKSHFLEQMTASLPINVNAEFKKEYDKNLKKDKLMVNVKSTYKTTGNQDVTVDMYIECCDNLVKKFNIEIDTASGEYVGYVRLSLEYIPNNSLIPTDDELDLYLPPLQ